MSDLTRVTDPGQLRRWHDIDRRARAADHVALPADPFEEQLPRLVGKVGDYYHELWLLTAAGEPVAAGEIALPFHDNLTAAALDLRVRPDRRGGGYGRRLVEHLLDRSRALGRRRAFFEIAEPLPPDEGAPPAPGVAGNALALRLGARAVLVEVRRLLELTAQVVGGLSSTIADVQRRQGAYSLVQWVDSAPAEVLEEMARLKGRMSVDAPLGEMDWEPEAWNADRFRAAQDLTLAQGRRVVTTGVRDDRSGRLVAFTDLTVNAAAPDVGYQMDTLVLGEHRGHRLGLRVKAANLALLHATVPAVRYVNTWNAASNRHMIAINDALGFRPVDRWWEWQLDW